MHAIAAVALAVFLMAVGVLHWVTPGYFRSLVPPWLGAAALLVAVSGAVEVGVAVLVLVPRTRAAGGWAAAGLITVYLVSHLDALRRAHPTRPGVLERPAGAVARLVVNLGYVAWAVMVARAPA
ncbi:hypothetical protein [Streptomyces cinnamoneus]|uniref:DoxX family protein n=1 Tax=Streptomyces cinnamoneus TaxID=53446 RepID=A0A918WHY7_STRCJ|nr:hypothetical protein [Streptomyces cinnamoneus]GHC45485.1 hypothetical protein GCM10010507_20970 [Streptomyces cinnamoneus]